MLRLEISVFFGEQRKNLRFQKHSDKSERDLRHHTNVIHTGKGGFPMLRNFYERACAREITQ